MSLTDWLETYEVHDVLPLKDQKLAWIFVTFIGNDAYSCYIRSVWNSGWDAPGEWNYPTKFEKKEEKNESQS